MSKIPQMIMMIGLPGSSKTTYAKEHYFDAVIHSSDALREELFGDADYQGDNEKLFVELHRRIRRDLQEGKDVVYDATNINSRRRRAFLKDLPKCEKIAVVMVEPYEICLKQNEQRERKVPVASIRRMLMNWNTPYFYEGWDTITIVRVKERTFCGADLIEELKDYDQMNSNHQLSLGDHMEKCRDILKLNTQNNELLYAAYFHDIGKPFTLSFIDKKDRICTDAHYYNHHKVGAYLSLLLSEYSTEKVDLLDVSILINHHMEPYFWEKDPSLEMKRKKLWGDRLYQDIIKLHKADVAAH